MKIRQCASTDRAFIINSWLLALRSSGLYRRAPERLLLPKLSKIIERFLDESQVLIVCDPVDETRIHGWLCHDDKYCYFAYTKFPFRRKGVFSALVKDAGLDRPKVRYVFNTLPAFRQAERYDWDYYPYGVL